MIQLITAISSDSCHRIQIQSITKFMESELKYKGIEKDVDCTLSIQPLTPPLIRDMQQFSQRNSKVEHITY